MDNPLYIFIQHNQNSMKIKKENGVAQNVPRLI